MRLLRLTTVAVTALAATLAGCGSGSDATTGGSDAEQLSITSPDDGAAVKVPFELTWESAVPLGPPDSGKDHVHVFVDGQENDYTVVGGNRFRVKALSPGTHDVQISLQRADHTPVGPEDSVEVTVTGRGAPTSPTDDDSGGGPYGY
jgi:hypothetical protein